MPERNHGRRPRIHFRLRSPAATAVIVTGATWWAISWATAAGQQVYPIFTPSDLDKTMATVGQNFGTLSRLIASGAFEDAKARAVRTREQLATTITFWRDRQRDDAIKMLRTATSKLDELDTVLSAEQVGSGAATAKLGEVNAACEACHAVYREQDPATKAYRLKAGVLR